MNSKGKKTKMIDSFNKDIEELQKLIRSGFAKNEEVIDHVENNDKSSVDFHIIDLMKIVVDFRKWFPEQNQVTEEEEINMEKLHTMLQDDISNHVTEAMNSFSEFVDSFEAKLLLIIQESGIMKEIIDNEKYGKADSNRAITKKKFR